MCSSPWAYCKCGGTKTKCALKRQRLLTSYVFFEPKLLGGELHQLVAPSVFGEHLEAGLAG
jgi:hypothetical protein